MTSTIIDPLAIIELTNLKASGQLGALAQHPQLGMKPEWMGELAKDKRIVVRQSLAKNPALSSGTEAARHLSKDRSKNAGTGFNHYYLYASI